MELAIRVGVSLAKWGVISGAGGGVGMQRPLATGLAAIAVIFVLSRLGGGGSAKAGLAPGASALKGAVYASQIPVYPKAKFADTMGGDYSDEIGGAVTFRSTSWFFQTTDPMTKVVEYYRANLPAGAKPSEAPEEEVAFEWTPPGAVEGEDVHVTIREGELQISETVKAR